MENKPLVSVIVINYNQAAFFEQRLESILNQTFQDFEIVILDDCSTDNSRNIIETYRFHPKIHQIIYNSTNSGSPFKQWKKGIELARGKYVWLAEADDWCELIFLETLVPALEDNPSCGLAYAQTYLMRDANQILALTQHPRLAEVIEGGQFIKNYMVRFPSVLNASMAIFKKDKAMQVADDFTEFRWCGDWCFWLSLAQQADVFVSAKTLNYFRRHEDSTVEKAIANGSILPEISQIALLLFTKYGIERTDCVKTVQSFYDNYAAKKPADTPLELPSLVTDFCQKLVVAPVFFKENYEKKVFRQKIKNQLKMGFGAIFRPFNHQK